MNGLVVNRLNDMAVVRTGRQAIDTFWLANREVIKDFPDKMVREEAERMMEEVIAIATSPDPRMENRKKLNNWVLEYSRFQVLVIDPPPAEDPNGLRGQPGITGELRPRLLELAQTDILREFMHAFDTPKTWDDVWTPVLLRFRIAYAWAHLFHTLRFALDDVNRAEGKDWFKPFVAVMCAWWEHHCRRALGMPPSLATSESAADQKCLIFSGFSNCVLDGARFPDLEWQERVAKIWGRC
jgi:hypothetical protein